MTEDEISRMKMTLQAAEQLKLAICETTHRIKVIEEHQVTFRIDCGGGGLSLGDSVGMEAVILGELKRQLKDHEAAFAKL